MVEVYRILGELGFRREQEISRMGMVVGCRIRLGLVYGVALVGCLSGYYRFDLWGWGRIGLCLISNKVKGYGIIRKHDI